MRFFVLYSSHTVENKQTAGNGVFEQEMKSANISGNRYGLKGEENRNWHNRRLVKRDATL